MARGDIHQDYQGGLCLIRTTYMVCPVPRPSGANLEAEIPATTEFVHIAITGVKMFFGSDQAGTPKKLTGFVFGAMVKTPPEEFKKEKLEFSLEAQLGGESADDPWSGTLEVIIMCFGKRG